MSVIRFPKLFNHNRSQPNSAENGHSPAIKPYSGMTGSSGHVKMRTFLIVIFCFLLIVFASNQKLVDFLFSALVGEAVEKTLDAASAGANLLFDNTRQPVPIFPTENRRQKVQKIDNAKKILTDIYRRLCRVQMVSHDNPVKYSIDVFNFFDKSIDGSTNNTEPVDRLSWRTLTSELANIYRDFNISEENPVIFGLNDVLLMYKSKLYMDAIQLSEAKLIAGSVQLADHVQTAKHLQKDLAVKLSQIQNYSGYGNGCPQP